MSKHTESKKEKLIGLYESKRKQLFFIPIAIVLLALVLLGVSYVQTGEFIQKDISISGGTIITVETTNPNYTMQEVREHYATEFDTIIQVSELRNAGQLVGLILRTNIESTEVRDALVLDTIGYFQVSESAISVEQTQSAFGQAFYASLIQGVIIAFILMGVTIYIVFRRLVPSLLIISTILTNMVVTLAVVSTFGLQLSSAGIAAFLMIIGYAVDTNILLSWNVLKKLDVPMNQRIRIAARTGLAMSATTIAALLVALFITNSEVISQILIILLVGLSFDLLNTWFFNAELLRRFIGEN